MEETDTQLKALPPQSHRKLWWRILLGGIGALLLAEALFFVWIWPDWQELKKGKVPPSALISDYKEQRESDPKLPTLRWTPVQKPFPKAIKNVFVIAEDSRFYEHDGIDVQALQDAMDYNYRHGKILLGASTITQQTAKNMFLSLARNPLRKFHELLLTYALEAHLSKAEILHIYLNVAEFGPGVFGLEAAARTYYNVSAHQLSTSQAIELAASLPSPKKNNPKTRTRPFQRRAQRIAVTLRAVDRYATQSRGGRDAAAAEELMKRMDELRREMTENPSEPAPVAASESADAPADLSLPLPASENPSEDGAPSPAASSPDAKMEEPPVGQLPPSDQSPLPPDPASEGQEKAAPEAEVPTSPEGGPP